MKSFRNRLRHASQMKMMMLLPFLTVLPLAAETIQFGPETPMRSCGIRAESYNKEAFGGSRLVADTKKQTEERYVLLDAFDYGKTPFRSCSVTLIFQTVDPLKTVLLASSNDGKTFSPLKTSKGKLSYLPKGYGKIRLSCRPEQEFRFLKISLPPKFREYWKCQLFDFEYANGDPASSPCTETRKIDFADQKIIRLDGLRRESWRNELYGTGTRLVPQKNQGSVIIDMRNIGAHFFGKLSLSVMSHASLQADPATRIFAFGSDDGRDFLPIRIIKKGKGKVLDGGYTLSEFVSCQARKFRFLKIELKDADPKKYWILQLAGLAVETDDGKPFDPKKKAVKPYAVLKSDAEMEGCLLTMDVPDGCRLTFQTGKTPLANRSLTLARKWKRSHIALEISGPRKFRTLEIFAESADGKKPKILRSEWIRDLREHRMKRAGGIPCYPLTGNPFRIGTLHAALAYSDRELAEPDLEKIPWDRITLRYTSTIPKLWNGNFFRVPGQEISGGIYRFQLENRQTDDKDVFLRIPQSAFLTDIYADGRKIAHFTEGFLPLTVDLTPYLSKNAKTEIVIRVFGYHHILQQNGTVLHPVGSMGKWTGGIAISPEIIFKNKLRGERFFISSTEKSLKLQAEAKNGSTAGFDGKISFVISGKDGAELLRKDLPVSLKPGARQTVSAEIPVGDKLKRWDVGNPNLYFARIDFSGNGTSVRGEQIRFGWRTVELRGDSLYLNGRKMRLIGPWAHIGEWTWKRYFKGKFLSHHEVYATLLKHGMNTGRLHCQPFHENFYDAADETGFLLIAESALNHRPANDSSLEHIRNFVLELRNHPSIIIWSGSNEFEHWITPRRESTMRFLADVRKEIRKLDTTRPVQHSGFGDALGELDICNIHYPAETVSFPRSLYWTRDPQKYVSFIYKDNVQRYDPRGRKPIAYGEERIPGRSATGFLFGEDALKAFYESAVPGHKKALDTVYRMLAKDWRLRIRAEREQNILLISPNIFYPGLDSAFVSELAKELRPGGAYPEFMDPVLIAGTERTVSCVVFDDSGYGLRGKAVMKLRTENRETPLAGKKEYLLAEIPFVLSGGELEKLPVKIRVPEIEAPAELLTVCLDPEGKEIYRDSTPVKVEKPFRPLPLNAELHLWGKSDKLCRFAKKHGIRTIPFQPDKGFKGVRFLAVSPDLPGNELLKNAEKLTGFAAEGGRIFLAERAISRNFLPSDALFPESAAVETCIGFPAYPGHPVLKNISAEDLRYWDPKTFAVSQIHAKKPEHGNFIPLADGGSGLGNLLLWKLFCGKGFWLISHLDLLDRAENTPQAERLLYQLMDHLFHAETKSWEQADILSAKNDFTGTFLKAEIRPRRTAGKKASVLLVTDESFRDFGADQILKAAKSYRTVVFFDPPRELAERISKELAGSPLKTAQLQAGRSSLFFTGRSPLYAGLNSADLNWNAPAIQSYSFIPGNGWRSFISAGMDAVWFGDGKMVILLNLPFNRDVPETGRKARFCSQLLTNLNVELERVSVRNFDSSAVKYRPVDLSRICNTSRERLFGNAIPGGNMTLAGIPWMLPRASRTNPNSMLRLNAHEKIDPEKIIFDTPFDIFQKKTPETVTLGLPVDQAESICFLHTTNRNWKVRQNSMTVAEYKICFNDGSSISVPLRLGEQLADARSARNIRRAKTAAVVPIEVNAPGEQAAIFMLEWSNPSPEKKIRCIQIINRYNPPHDLMLLGVTLRETNQQFK